MRSFEKYEKLPVVAHVLQKGISHFTMLFCRGRQRNVPGIITCTAIFLLIKPFVGDTSQEDLSEKANIMLLVRLLQSLISRRKQAHKLT